MRYTRQIGIKSNTLLAAVMAKVMLGDIWISMYLNWYSLGGAALAAASSYSLSVISIFFIIFS